MKLNEPGKQVSEKRDPWQWAKHAKLCSNLIQAEERTLGCSGLSAGESFNYSIRGTPSQGRRRGNENAEFFRSRRR